MRRGFWGLVCLFVLSAELVHAQLSLTASGQVGIGTTPSNTARLTVKDSIAFEGAQPALRGKDKLILGTDAGDILTLSSASLMATFAGAISTTSLVVANTMSSTSVNANSVTALNLSATTFTGAVVNAGSLYMTVDPGDPSSSNWHWLWWDVATKQVLRGTSSRRYKEDIRPLETDYRTLLRAQPYSFRYKNGPRGVGYLAEELDELGMRDVVVYDSEKRPDSIHYPFLILYATEILKDHDRELKDLAAENAVLRGEIAALRADLEALRSALPARGKE